MALTEHYHTKFEEGKFYHLYNRSVDRKPMFNNDGNYEFFLRKYDLYLSPVVDTYAYCLLGNHFHLLVRIQDLTTFKEIHILPAEKHAHDIVSHQLRKFFQSYAMAFNKQNDRIGTLFQTPIKRALVDNDNYFTQLIYYIHANPELHGLIDDFKDWKWSSYGRILAENPSKLKKKEVIEWFGGKDAYQVFHSNSQKLTPNKKYILEED